MAGLQAARARGRKGGRTLSLTKAQVRMIHAAMAHRDTPVSDLCRELRISPVTLYRYSTREGTFETTRNASSALRWVTQIEFPGDGGLCIELDI